MDPSSLPSTVLMEFISLGPFSFLLVLSTAVFKFLLKQFLFLQTFSINSRRKKSVAFVLCVSFTHAGFMLLEKLEILEEHWDLSETGICRMPVSE